MHGQQNIKKQKKKVEAKQNGLEKSKFNQAYQWPTPLKLASHNHDQSESGHGLRLLYKHLMPYNCKYPCLCC